MQDKNALHNSNSIENNNSSHNTLEQLWQDSCWYSGNADYIEQLYETFLRDPNSVSLEWQDVFNRLPQNPEQVAPDVSHHSVREHFLYLARNADRVQPIPVASVSTEHERQQVKVLSLVNAYRVRGHQKAALDPLGIMTRTPVPDLTLGHHGLSSGDLDTIFHVGSLFIGQEEASLRIIIDSLEATYCSTLGAEYMHIVDTAEKRWIQRRLESVRSHPNFASETKLHLLERLIAAEGLEKSLASRYPGYKRFGLEGGDSLIPLMDEVIQRVGSYKAKEIVVGMAHRGRLNVLVNILGKKPVELFGEFEGKIRSVGSGDVKYHQGFSSNIMTPTGEVHIALASNPSHLEIVSPVVHGSVRARQDRRNDEAGDIVVPLILHGDAAFAGQGVVMETMQMSQTRGYKTGGTVHVIVNNQVGFTTHEQVDARSTEYCTDVAKMVQAPIFHVNGDDPEAVYFVAQLAVDYRMAFKKDVVIDLICYRRHGHNETDEPSGTQPLMYAAIKDRPSVRQLYSEKLIQENVLDAQRLDTMIQEYRQALDSGEHVVKSLVREPNPELFVDWTPYLGHGWIPYANTQFDLIRLQELAAKINEIPQGFVLQKQVAKIIDDRRKMAVGAAPINWGFAEIMAYATLLSEGHPIRMSGQDVRRGTFSHRYAAVFNQKDGSCYMPLKEVMKEHARFDLYDSLLSEEAVLGFEYGYVTTRPEGLVIWEAQFGDFANGAQVVIDQFISSGETKWSRVCGLVLYLPHGYEGQGPEHSSARLERFLQLCAEINMQVCVPSTPAQMFHMIRRQAIRPSRKPLIVMTPKSLLRHRLCVSTLEDLSNGHFHLMIDDTTVNDANAVNHVIISSGKVFYDLLEKKQNESQDAVALVRLEQIYPFPEQELENILNKYPNTKSVIWCQEEPLNQGAWYYIQHHLRHVIDRSVNVPLNFAGRAASASPAVGYPSM
ncbi:MAG: 2-oxoglutarate dehydrogenase E1 component, partial [Pseudomonadota bacterium]